MPGVAALRFTGGRYRCTQCDKIAYRSEEQAARAAIRNKQRPYFNTECGWHHTTNKNAKAWLANQLSPEAQEVPVSSSIVLRDYQDASLDHLYKYFPEHPGGHPVVALPTGTGKSIIIAELVRRAVTQWPGTRVVMLTHVKELIEQNHKTLINVFPTAPAGIYSAGLKRKEIADVTFAGIQSVHKKADQFGHVDLVLIDECHLVSTKGNTMYQRFIKALMETNPQLRVVGFSATPFRLGQGMLTDNKGLFTDVAFDLTSRESFNWLIAQGWLAPLVPRHPELIIDVAGVKIQGGEFVLSDLQGLVDRDEITLAALAEAQQVAVDRKHWLVFASGVEHAEHITAFLNDYFGIPAAVVHSKLTSDERSEAIAGFRSGKYRALVNNNILTTGFDFPEIDCIVMLRPTQSPGLWVQMLGRGTRPAEGKENCLVLDFAGNTRRLGPINDPVLPLPKGKGPKGVAPVRLCEHCMTYSHASVRFCDNCGAEFPKAVNFGRVASHEELIAGDVPETVFFDITKVIYSVHQKPGRPDSMKVTYYCGLRRFNEYICLDHGGYASRVARQWWEIRSPWGVPPSVEDGMLAVNHLRTPTKIGVIDKGKYPEIVSYGFE